MTKVDLSPKGLKALRAVEKAATPGEWAIRDHDTYSVPARVLVPYSAADNELKCAARNALVPLLGALEEERATSAALRAEVERLREEIEALTHEGRQGELEQANVGLAAENERLKEAERIGTRGPGMLALRKENDILIRELEAKRKDYSDLTEILRSTTAKLAGGRGGDD